LYEGLWGVLGPETGEKSIPVGWIAIKEWSAAEALVFLLLTPTDRCYCW
jgi:hypothetical protein